MLRGPADEGGEVLVGKARADNQDGHAVFRVVLCGRVRRRVSGVTRMLKVRNLQTKTDLYCDNKALVINLHCVGSHAHVPRRLHRLLALMDFPVFLE